MMWLSHLLAGLIGCLLGFVAGIVLCLCGVYSDESKMKQEQDDRWWAAEQQKFNQSN